MNDSRAIILMGVSGCGKTTLAKGLAGRLGWIFVEGDDCHPAGNIQKMSAGVPLTDEDRAPFLRNVANAISSRSGSGVVASCSALKREYRDLIRSICPQARFVLPLLPRGELHDRLQSRSGHFMPASMVDSQLATLEMPRDANDAVVIDGTLSTGSQVDAIIEYFGPWLKFSQS